jgi:hypothetical protein
MKSSGMIGLMYNMQGRALKYIHKTTEKGA